MKTLYIDCSMGAAGDMLMGALLSLLSSDEQETWLDGINSAGIPGVRVEAFSDSKCGIRGLHVKVKVHGKEEQPGDDAHGHDHEHEEVAEALEHHAKSHTSLKEILHLISKMKVSEQVKKDTAAIYQLIAHAESEVHGTAVSEIHFHEVGMMDALADITGCAMLLERIGAERIIVSSINVGYGRVRCAHGILPVPAPATANLLRGIPCYAGETQGELCTPTGAALLKYYADAYGNMPVMTVAQVGYGTGNKDFAQANVLRVMLGAASDNEEGGADDVMELQCNLDDMTGEEIGYAMEVLMEQGALDVFTVPIGMKKSRPGILLCVLCRLEDEERMARLLFRHTTTIGIRRHICARRTLGRKMVEVRGDFGEAVCKESAGYGVKKHKIEYEDLRRIAAQEGISLREAGKRAEQELLGRENAGEEGAVSETGAELSQDRLSSELIEKYENLKGMLKRMGNVAVAFSGGVDSTFLLKTAKEALGSHVIAITADSAFFPRREEREAVDFCRREGIRRVSFAFDVDAVEGLCQNPSDRCYLCKKRLMGGMLDIAEREGGYILVEGSNLDDVKDYRPGMRALSELGVKSPLRDAGLTKEQIRQLSSYLGLPTWNKPSFACLATRIPYDETITAEKLRRIEQAEQFLMELGFSQVRVRSHGDMARIEVLPQEMHRMMEEEVCGRVTECLSQLGFSHISLDLQGYRTGNMNNLTINVKK